MFYPSLVSRLKTQHEGIGAIISGLDEATLNRNPAPGKWSIHDNIAHLALYQLHFIRRLNEIVAGGNPSYERYVAANDPDFADWLSRTTPDLLQRLLQDREQLSKSVLALPETALTMKGRHARFGILTLPEWTEFFLLHEAHHLYTIFQLAHG